MRVPEGPQQGPSAWVWVWVPGRGWIEASIGTTGAVPGIAYLLPGYDRP